MYFFRGKNLWVKAFCVVVNVSLSTPLGSKEDDMMAYVFVIAKEEDTHEPITFYKAINSSEKDEWVRSMEEEMSSLKKNHTWELIDQPHARLVARGFTRRAEIDYNEVFSPVVRHTSIRVILSLTACEDYELEQLDVKTAFLHGNLEETIYMRQLPIFEEGTSNKVKMDDPNITIEEYIRLEEEKARKRGKVYNWETATYGKIWNDEDVHDLRSVETEFPAIVLNDALTSEVTLSYYMVVYDKTNSENENNKVNMPSFPSPEPTVSYFDALTSKLDFLTEATVSPQHIDEFNLKDETSSSECDEEEQNILYFNDLFPFNVIYPDDSKSDKDNDDDKIDINSLRGDLRKEIDNVGVVFINLETSKCWSLEISRRLFNTFFLMESI
ncbi:putative reverse transcriptase domain-containing protein [Tanacetum coccineum]|uniref:Reverse transcriptase domain-containing protein n=1 Tax=Tanacetum coccineum TaxID=301880 RepID=A0ABQ5HTF0_9ASTR